MAAPAACSWRPARPAGYPERSVHGAASNPLFLHREEAHPQELRQARERSQRALSADDAEGLVRRLPAERRSTAKAQARRAASGVPLRVPDRLAQRVRRDEVHRVQHGQARVRHARVPAARPDLRRRRAGEAADDHLRPRVGAGQDGQGDQGAGGLHGRSSAHDRLRLVHRQRHRARHRLAAAPLAGRVLRARQGQDALERQAAVLGADHSLPRLVARLRVRPEGHPLLPRRPPPQDAGDDPAEGDRPESGSDPRQLLRLRQLPPDGLGRAARVRRRSPARRDRALRHHRQGRQGHRREGQADHGAPRAPDRAVGDQVHLGARGLRRRPHAGAQRRRRRDRRDPGQGQRRADRSAAEEAAPGRRQGNPRALHQRARRRRLHLADARVRRDRRPARRARRHLPHDAARRAADRRRGRGAVPSPVLLGRHLRPVARRPDEVQRPRRPRRARRRDDAVERGHPRRRQDPGRAAQRPRRGRRHRPPRQPARALRRRAGREPVPLGPRPDREGGQGAPRPGRDRSADAARPDQLEADLGGAEGILRRLAVEPVHGPDQPAQRDHAQAARLGPGPGRPDPRARRLRSPRRAPDALRPGLPDRDAGRPEHRPDQLARPVRAAQRVRLPRDAVPPRRRRQGDEPDRLPVGDRGRQVRHRPGERDARRRRQARSTSWSRRATTANRC